MLVSITLLEVAEVSDMGLFLERLGNDFLSMESVGKTAYAFRRALRIAHGVCLGDSTTAADPAGALTAGTGSAQFSDFMVRSSI